MNTKTGEISDMDAVLKRMYDNEVVTKLRSACGAALESSTDDAAGAIDAADAERLLAKARQAGWKDIVIGSCVGPINGWMWEVLAADVARQSITIRPRFKQGSPSPSKRRLARGRRKSRQSR